MSLIDAIANSIADNLGVVVSKGVNAPAPAASSADNNFKALLAIGSEEPAPADEESRDPSSARDDKHRDKEQPAYNAAVAIVDVPAPAASQPEKPQAQYDNNSVRVSEDRPAANAPADKPEPKRASDDKALPANDQTKTTRPQEVGARTSVPSEDDKPVTPADIRNALAEQFGNIADILEAFIQQLSGGTVVSAIANADITNPSAATDVDDLTGENAQARINLFKDILALVRQLKQALLNAAANGGGAVTIVQEQVSVTTLQVDVSAGQQDPQSQLANITSLVDQLNSKLASLLETFPVQDDAANANLSQLGELKSQLKDSIGAIRTQLDQLSNANEQNYNSVLERFQALLGSQQSQDDQQDNALLRQTLSLLARATGIPEPRETLTAVPSATVPANDKVQATPNNIIAPATTPVVPDANTSSNNNSGNQQGNTGGQGAPQALAGVAGASANATSVGNSTFARALELTGGKPIPEQISVQIKTAIADGSSKITIQLDPEDLGKLDIRLHVKADGKTGVVITADNNNTLNLLQRDANQLLRALHDAGLQTDSGSLSFNLRGDQQGQQGNSQQSAGNYQKAQPGEDDEVLIQAVTRQYTLNLNDGLDITI